MKKRSLCKAVISLMSLAFISLGLPGGARAADPLPLNQIPVPEPPNLAEFVKDKAAAITLGKALFWDMQVGSDGLTACASCHYRAGADPLNIRAKNQLHPGPDGAFSVLLPGPNQTLTAGDFPFHQVAPVDTRLGDPATVTNDKNDVAGSQGVVLNLFGNIVPGNPVDAIALALYDPIFGTLRQVTGRNTPPAVNAIFNYANFWDGRASNIFNGSSPIGPLDPTAGVWVNGGGPSEPVMTKVPVSIPNGSLASQATGPPLSGVEMSWAGRTWPELGRKMLSLPTPLGSQVVSPQDSALGPLSKAPANGINSTYGDMIKAAFQSKYWSLGLTTPDGFTQMEANFSLFWGLAVQLYEATLVSDQTPFDQYLAGNAAAMNANAIAGFGIFQSKCAVCHAGSELSDATVSFALANGLIMQGATNAGNAISDTGFHNLGVRPTADDVGRGGVINFDLSFAQQAVLEAQGTLPFPALQPLPDGVAAAVPVAVNGAFKTPSLRNVALTPPYMHDGSMATLAEVVEFYSRHGNFANFEQADDMNLGGTLRGAADKRAEVVAFLEALTDPRVANDTAPFDHPELRIPAGGAAGDGFITLPATGEGATATVHAAETRTLADLPQATVMGAPAGETNANAVTLTVGGTNVTQYLYQLDGGALSAATPIATPINISDLHSGPHTVNIVGLDATGNAQPAGRATKASWTVKIPVTLATTAVKTNKDSHTITGTVDPGSTVTVTAGPGVTAGPVAVDATGNFTCQVSGLNSGPQNITVTATDPAGATTTSAAIAITMIRPDGRINKGPSVSVADAVKALRIDVGLDTPTEDEKLSGDCAPLVNGVPAPNGKLDTSDALVILKKAVGLINF